MKVDDLVNTLKFIDSKSNLMLTIDRILQMYIQTFSIVLGSSQFYINKVHSYSKLIKLKRPEFYTPTGDFPGTEQGPSAPKKSKRDSSESEEDLGSGNE